MSITAMIAFVLFGFFLGSSLTATFFLREATTWARRAWVAQNAKVRLRKQIAALRSLPSNKVSYLPGYVMPAMPVSKEDDTRVEELFRRKTRDKP